MSNIIPIESLAQLIGSEASIAWFDPLNRAAYAYGINTNRRAAAWLGQLMEETKKFQVFEENLNYCASQLIRVFPLHFKNLGQAEHVALGGRQAIANRVYANRLGNGSESSGDGWTYRGRGLIQTTGKANYHSAGQAVGFDFLSDPDALLDPDLSAAVAGWYWEIHGCNELADNADYAAITRAINGGENGLGVRVAYSEQAASALEMSA